MIEIQKMRLKTRSFELKKYILLSLPVIGLAQA
jgi:hypothetical protein